MTLPRDERRVVLACELFWRQHGRGPAWNDLRRALRMWRPGELDELLWRLRRNGLVRFSSQPHSTRPTPAGLRAALEEEQR